MVLVQRPTWTDVGFLCAIIGFLLAVLIMRDSQRPTPPPAAAEHAKPEDAATGKRTYRFPDTKASGQ